MTTNTINNSSSQSAFFFLFALAVSITRDAAGYTITTPEIRPTRLNRPGRKVGMDMDPKAYRHGETPNINVAGQNNVVFDVTAVQRPYRTTYDLGLGKNQPVTLTNPLQNSKASEERTVYEAIHYWNEYESVREYPRPQSSTSTSTSTSIPAGKARKVLPVVNPTRQNRDVLAIWSNSDGRRKEHPQQHQIIRESAAPTIMTSFSSRPVKLDVNTVWVEMLIHSEQIKRQASLLAAAAAAVN